MKIMLMKSHQSLRQKHRGRQNRAGKPTTTKTLAGHKVNLKVAFYFWKLLQGGDVVLEKYAGGGATRKVWKSCQLLKLDPTKAAQKAINQVLAMGKIGTIRKITPSSKNGCLSDQCFDFWIILIIWGLLRCNITEEKTTYLLGLKPILGGADAEGKDVMGSAYHQFNQMIINIEFFIKVMERFPIAEQTVKKNSTEK